MDTKSIQQLFESSVDSHPNNPAIQDGEFKVTYSELDKRANRIAWYLISAGLNPGDRVSIMLPRSVDAYASILGVIKAGAAYVPIDPEYPSERSHFILSNSGSRAVITYSSFQDKVSEFDGVRIFLNKNSVHLEQMSQERPEIGYGEENTDRLCYVIYTSGTTGKPKGVKISHSNLRSLVEAESEVFGVKSSDRVAQSASLSFDVSVEEMWLAFYAGACLVPVPQSVARSGSDYGNFIEKNEVTVISVVPTLLSLVDGGLSCVRLIILGGEACPEWLAERWHKPGRRIVNTYGPTETTVAATYTDLEPGRRVTIGQPLPRYRIYLLDEELNPVAQGITGEIFIGGPGVGLGYIGLRQKNIYSFLKDSFSQDASCSRMYRTGDLGKLTEEGNIEFAGRRDSQVKLRGFRIELEEIESQINRFPGVQSSASAVKLDKSGIQLLVAYLVLKPGASLDMRGLRERLKATLPSYMIPNIIQTLPDLPRLPSGKLDRASLPAPEISEKKKERSADPVESAIQQACEKVFHPIQVSLNDDFFLNLGGHSLIAARLVSELRRDERFADISVADIYDNPTVKSLANYFKTRKSDKTSDMRYENLVRELKAADKPRQRKKLIPSIAQAIGLYFVYFVQALEWITPYLVFFMLYQTGRGLIFSIEWAILSAVLVFPALTAFGIIVKWLVLGRIKPGRYPLWGSYYLRWWFVQSVISSIPLDYLAGTPLLPAIYRLLGARIGRNVHLETDHIAAFDLITIGDDTSVDEGANISGYSVENGELIIAPVMIGSNCFVGTKAVIMEGAVMDDYARLEDLSLLETGQKIPKGETWSGSPAKYTHTGTRAVENEEVQDHPKKGSRFLYPLYAALSISLPLVVISTISPGILYLLTLNPLKEPLKYLAAVPLVGASFVVLMMSELVILKKLLLKNVQQGTYSVHGGFYIRNWIFDRMQALSLDLIGSLRATLYVVPWFRLLGAKVGKSVELSTAAPSVPDLIEIKFGGTIADEVSFGTPHIENGVMTVGRTVLGEKAFLGNSSVVPTGTQIGDGSLIGVSSISPRNREDASSTNATWLGSPPIKLPRHQLSDKYSEEKTYQPSLKLKIKRGLVELLRITLPPAGFILVSTAVLEGTLSMWRTFGLWTAIALIPVWYASVGAIMCLSVISAKWLVAGRYKPFAHPLWSGFVWRLEFVNALYEFMASPLFLEALRGTPFLKGFLRLFGVRMGKNCYIGTTGFLEWDLVEIGDNVCLNEDCVLQTHLFEDRVLKGSNLKVGDGCTIGADSIVLYDSAMEPGSSLGPLSLLMKGETLPNDTKWSGIPARKEKVYYVQSPLQEQQRE